MTEKPSLEAAVVHYGVKGMRWGVRKERTPAQELARVQKKLDKVDYNKYLEGVSLRGWGAQKLQKKYARRDPDFANNRLSPEKAAAFDKIAARRAKRSVALRGAAEAAVVVGGVYGLTKAMKSSPQAQTGALISGAILAGQVGHMRIEQISAINSSLKVDALKRERDRLKKLNR